MDKKQKLLDYENYLLKEIEHHEKRLEEALKNEASVNYNESDSSDLEYELKINNAPSTLDLKLKKKQLKTCYLATAELADVSIVQSEMSIVPDDPEFDGEPISEPGVWKSVIAECRIGMVPFSINFFLHEANRLFGPIAFRGLQVLPIKKPQAMELSKSVLSRLKKPSDAVQLLRSYESAYRSRRMTLANLSDKYGGFVSLEAKTDGGYIVKCDEILNLTWVLQNKLSHLSRFQHKMSFDLEYIDESYIKIIRKANKKLENQSIQTNERTQLLAAIIGACLQAKASLGNQSESENERVVQNEGNIMAPPKTIPKKSQKQATHRTVNESPEVSGDMREKQVSASQIDEPNVASTSESNHVAIEDRITDNIDHKKRKMVAAEQLNVKKMKGNVEIKKPSVNKENGKANAVNKANGASKGNDKTSVVKQSDAGLNPNKNKTVKKNVANGNAVITKNVGTHNVPKATKVHKVQTNVKRVNTNNVKCVNITGNVQKSNTVNTQKVNDNINNKNGKQQKANDKVSSHRNNDQQKANDKASSHRNNDQQKANDKVSSHRNNDQQKANDKASSHRNNDQQKANDKASVHRNNDHKKIQTQKINDTDKGNPQMLGAKRKVAKSKIPQNEKSKNPFTGRVKPVHHTKPTNIPIPKRT